MNQRELPYKAENGVLTGPTIEGSILFFDHAMAEATAINYNKIFESGRLLSKEVVEAGQILRDELQANDEGRGSSNVARVEMRERWDAALLSEQPEKEGEGDADKNRPALSGSPLRSGPEDGTPPTIANAPAHMPPDECITIPANVFNFLHGTADIHGLFFGDPHPDFRKQGKYWWRKLLVPVIEHPDAPTEPPTTPQQ